VRTYYDRAAAEVPVLSGGGGWNGSTFPVVEREGRAICRPPRYKRGKSASRPTPVMGFGFREEEISAKLIDQHDDASITVS
jgi:hypothetical protein